MNATPWLSDAEVAELCEPLVQPAAMCRYLQDTLKIKCRRKPNGRPLVLRSAVEGLDDATRARKAPREREAPRPDVHGLVLQFSRKGG